MTALIVGLVLFLGMHSLGFLAPGWRARTVARLGQDTWMGIAGMIGLIGFALLIWGYGEARAVPVPIWAPPVWTRHIGLLIMLPVFPLLLAMGLPGRIQSAVGHPMVTAVILWAIAHLIANGNLADIVLFGSFLVWSVADRLSFLFRTAVPVQGAPPGKYNDLIAVVAGVALYLAFFFWLHRWMFGVSPLGSA